MFLTGPDAEDGQAEAQGVGAEKDAERRSQFAAQRGQILDEVFLVGVVQFNRQPLPHRQLR